MLHMLAHQDIHTVYDESQIWCRDGTALFTKSQKTLSVLSDARIAFLVEPLFSWETDYGIQQMLKAELSQYYLCVICLILTVVSHYCCQ